MQEVVPVKRFTSAVAAALLLAGLLAYGTSSPASQPAPGSNPLPGLSRAPPERSHVRGRVEQRILAGSYTYLALRSDDHALRWAVTLGRGAPEGAQVAVRSVGSSPHFYSRRLRRTFDDLLFGFVSPLD
jgi:hypothetical protein